MTAPDRVSEVCTAVKCKYKQSSTRCI